MRAAAMRGCRACGAPPAAAAAEEGKLRRCAGCERVAYCSAACQATDWRRHKPFCGGASPEALLADAACAVCSHAAAEEAPQAALLLSCVHFVHAACQATLGGCPTCAAACAR
jgi:hypothetical protein